METASASYVRKRVPAKVREIFGAEGGEQSPNVINNLAGEPAVLATASRPIAREPTPKPEAAASPASLIARRPVR